MAFAASSPRESPGDGCTGRDADIAAALLEQVWPCEVSVAERGGGGYRVTLAASAARHLGIGTRSQIPGWHLTRRLGVHAEVSDVAPAAGHRTAFTVTLSPQAQDPC